MRGQSANTSLTLLRMDSVMDGIAVGPTVKLQPPSSGSNSSHMRRTPDREAKEGAGRRIETVQALASAAIGGLLRGKEDGGMYVGGRPPEIETIAGIARTETGHRVVTGVRAAKEIEGSVRRVAGETCDRNGLT